MEHSLTLDQLISNSIADHQAGRIAEAETGYCKVLASDPAQFDALHLLGVLHHQRGEHRQAIELIDRALRRDPSAFPALFNMGLAYLALDEINAAHDCFRRAVQVNPGHVESREKLVEIYRRLGNAEGELLELQQVASLRPDSASAHNNLGCALQLAGRYDAARASYARSLELDPQLAGAAFNMGELLRLVGRHSDSITYFRRAIAIKRDFIEAHYKLAIALHTQGLRGDAIRSIRTALNVAPEHAESHWALAMLQLPLVRGSQEPPDTSRAAFTAELRLLDAWFSGGRVQDGHKAVGSQQPFYLAYHDQSNIELLSRYGDLCARLMYQWQVDQRIETPAIDRKKPIRLAIVSAHVFDQSVWTAITRGLCEHIDRDRFSTHVFYPSIIHDSETDAAQSLVSTFVSGRKSLRQWLDAILELRPDVILFPEVGMDYMTTKLASLRLAPIQVAAWGHPITTGLPTIDYFLSAVAFEPPDAQTHYRERLLALPNLGCCYRTLRVEAQAPNFDDWGLDAETPILLCPGTPYKYVPEHDHVYVEIARRLGRARFVFFTDICERLSDIVQHRLQRAFQQAGCDPRRFLLLIPRQERPAFFGVMQRADVYLDTIGFSGFNTAMQAVECGLPIVTHWGRFMRGRLAAGILARMGLNDLVARTKAEYVDLAVRLCQDAGFRANVRDRIEVSRDVLFNDMAPVRAFEDLLVDLTHRP
jgi:protein O-GlcNAc transferase